MRMTEEVLVRASLEEVFRIASSPEHMPAWNPSVVSSTLYGDIGEGAVVVQEARVLGRRFATTYLVTRWEPPNAVTFSAISGPMDIEGTLECRADRPGTRLSWTVRGDACDFFPVAASLLRAAGRREMRSCLRRLKRLLEEGRLRRRRAPSSVSVPRRADLSGR